MMRISTLFGGLALGVLALLGATPDSAHAQNTIQCASQEDKRTVCDADTRGGVYLSRQLSDAPCTYNRTWGYTRTAVWVSNGCRGEFVVDNPPRGTPISEADAVRICRNAVVAQVGNITPSAVTVEVGGPNGQGMRTVKWRTNGWSGSCRIQANGTVTKLDIERRGR